jgi:uncharacterized protein YdhG (YjbR/CyaY superfamily)
MEKPQNIDEYIALFPRDVQKLLGEMRAAIRDAAPGAAEVLSYGIPAFKLNGLLVWFAAHTKHIGFYPRGSGIEKFLPELSRYKFAKGSVQFPFDQPLPLDLIRRIVKFRTAENLERAKRRKK